MVLFAIGIMAGLALGMIIDDRSDAQLALRHRLDHHLELLIVAQIRLRLRGDPADRLPELVEERCRPTQYGTEQRHGDTDRDEDKEYPDYELESPYWDELSDWLLHMSPSAQAIRLSARPKPSLRAGVPPASDASAGSPSRGGPRSGLGSRSSSRNSACSSPRKEKRRRPLWPSSIPKTGKR